MDEIKKEIIKQMIIHKNKKSLSYINQIRDDIQDFEEDPQKDIMALVYSVTNNARVLEKNQHEIEMLARLVS